MSLVFSPRLLILNYRQVKLYSPWLPEVDSVMYRLRESGLIEKFLLLHLPIEAITKRKKQNELNPIDISLLMTPLFFLCTGLAFTAVVFAGRLEF